MQKNDHNLPLFGGIAAAIGASLCCVGPFLLLTLGIGGAWIGNLTRLEPYRPLFIIAVLVLFGWAGWKLYRPTTVCEPGTACAIPSVRKRRQLIFWLIALIALFLVTSSVWIPLVA
ncbi:mercuric transporter MerT family protein [Shewanella baltica]|uniref:mercuric transporter MerT family protein n=1 Tax=Shewanella baltica TaxID=62322 RepID=UPI000E0302E7|nr:mercuric transporter MerT family protein [Shewanella baltica]SUI58865.1 putative mercuric transport protein [Shewanella baltica]